MKHGIHLTKTEIVVLTLALLFAVGMLLYRAGRTGDGAWQVTTQKNAGQEETITAVNVNTATVEELIGVEGIGPTLAERIVEYREEHGPFQSVEELDNVKGIGPSLIENIRFLVCVEDEQ